MVAVSKTVDFRGRSADARAASQAHRTITRRTTRSSRAREGVRVAGALLALALTACSGGPTSSPGDGGGGGDGGEDGDGHIANGGTVTWMETARPAREAFVLRGTVPVPRGVFPRADGKIPFRMLDYDGSPVETQMEIVTRYPADEHGADVVEVIGRVRPDPALELGAQVTYRIVVDPQPAPPGPGTPGLEDLALGTADVPTVMLDMLSDPAAIRISAFDCFGNEYVCHPLDGTGEKVLERYGRNLTELRVYQTMVPVSPDPGPTGTLPHFFGVHTYLTTYRGEELLGLDLRFNNAQCGHDQTSELDDPLDTVYFQRIEVAVPEGARLQQAFEDPFFGAPYVDGDERIYPIVAPLGDGTMHAMRWQGQFHRRLILSTAAATWPARSYLDYDGRGFATRGTATTDGHEFYSWWNRNTARYFPQSSQLPSLDHVGLGNLRAAVNGNYQHLKERLEQGNSDGQYPVESSVLGWGHPYGVAYGGMTGGSEVWMTEGMDTIASRSVKGIAYYRALHRMQMDRMPHAMFRIDGEPTSVDDWLTPGAEGEEYVPFEHFIVPVLKDDDPFGFDQAPQFQIQHVVGAGLQPDYYSLHTRYDPYDYQHHVRFTRGAKALVWLSNDSIAKDDLRMAAEMFNLSYHQYNNGYYGGTQGSGLRGNLEYVALHPGKGLPFGRGESWGLDCAIAAFASSPPEWRDKKRPWFDLVLGMLNDGQASCSGFIQSQVVPKFLNARYHARQGIEQSITENMLRGMYRTVYEGADPARAALTADVLEASLYAFISKMAWFPGESGPWSHTAVGPLDIWEPIWCTWTDLPSDGYTPVYENYQNWSSFAYAYELTQDSSFLDKAAQEIGGGDLLTKLEQGGMNNIENKAALLALMQRLNGDI